MLKEIAIPHIPVAIHFVQFLKLIYSKTSVIISPEMITIHITSFKFRIDSP